MKFIKKRDSVERAFSGVVFVAKKGDNMNMSFYTIKMSNKFSPRCTE